MRKTFLKVWFAALACCAFVFSAHAMRYTASTIDALNRILESTASSKVSQSGAANGSYYLSDGDNINIAGDYALTKSLTIRKKISFTKGDGAATRTLSRGSANYNITIQRDADLSLQNVVVDGGNLTGSAALFVVEEGGGLYLKTGGVIQNVRRSADGAAVLVDGGEVHMLAGTIRNCQAVNGYSGGGVLVSKGTMTMSGGTITGCEAGHEGGAILVGRWGTTNDAKLYLTGGTITGNKSCTASGYASAGGAVCALIRTAYIYVSGSPVVQGNTQGTSANNVAVYNASWASHLVQNGDLSSTANLGVSLPTTGSTRREAAGVQFGVASGTPSGSDRFFWDGNAAVRGVRAGAVLKWADWDPVCRLTSNGLTYESLPDAYAAAAATDEIQLLKDLTLPGNAVLSLDKNLTLSSDPGQVYTLARGGTGSSVAVPDGKSLTLANIVVDGANLDGTSAMFQVAAGGTLTVNDGATIRNCRNVSSRGGAVFLGATATTTTVTTNVFTYYKVAFRKTYGSGGDFQLSEVKLFDANGNRINGGSYMAADKNTDPSKLAVRQCTYLTSGNNYWINNGTHEGPANLFDGDTATKMGGGFGLTDASDETKWMTVAFRVPDNSAPAAGYMFTTANDSGRNRNPTAWTLYGSLDGTNWTELDSRTDGTPTNAYFTDYAGSPWAVQGFDTTTSTSGRNAAATLNLAGGAIADCSAVQGGGAVYAASATGTSGTVSAGVNVSGAPQVAGNTAGGAESNILPENGEQVKLAETFTGSVGVSYPAATPEGAVFGSAGSHAGADHFFYDGDRSAVIGASENRKLVWIASDVAQIGSVKYHTLAEAVAAAKDGDTIELLTNVKLDADVAIDKNVTLTSVAGKNYTLTRAADAQLNVTAGALTLKNLTVDGAQMAATKPLVNVAAGAALNLANGATVTGATAGGIAAAGTVNVSGNPVVTGNTAAGKASDLAPTSANVLNLVGDFTGSIGVQWPRDVAGKELSGRPFGVATVFAGAENFFFDGKTKIAGTRSEEGRLAWPEITEEEIPFGDGGDTIVYDGAASAMTLPDGDLVLVFDDVSKVGTFTLPKNARARILLVGGGGAGGSMGVGVAGAAGGGGAGGFIDRETLLAPGEYTVELGRGGLRVQTVAQSWVGDEGQNSYLKCNDEIVAAAKGGGGGGTVKFGGAGTSGGAGGGGAWYGNAALAGGTGTEGQGRAGGTTDDADHGAGGGGAQTAGGAQGAVGAGRTSDITGAEVLYAQGGRGGDRTDASYEAQAGVGPGFGGDGAVTGFGGAGADGLVVVRIHRLFDYTLVPYPDYVSAFPWKAGETYVAFDPANLTDLQKAAIANLDELNTGKYRTQTTCGQDEKAADSGIGLYAFNLRLNDEYRWDNGTEKGTDSAYLCYWRVTDPDTVGHAGVDVQKTVSFADGKNATISILAHSTPEARLYVPNVLVVGTLCNAHGFSQDVLAAALNAAAKNGNVHYEFYNTVNSTSGVETELAGDLAVGGTFNRSVDMSTGQHGGLYGFYETLSKVVNSGKQYDYVIFSFDRSLVGTYFPGTHPDEAAISAWLKPIYDRNAVIWLVDDSEDSDKKPVVTQYPWAPSQYLYVHFSGSQSDYWSSLYQWEYSYGNIAKGDETRAKAASFKALRAMLGLFDPGYYATAAQNWAYAETYYNNNVVSGQNPTDTAKIQATAGHAIENQVVYDNAKNVAEIIERVVKPVPATLTLTDAVNVEQKGLKILEARASWTLDRNGAWTELKPHDTDDTSAGSGLYYVLEDGVRTGVKIRLPSIQDEAWIKLDIDVEDEGRFLSSINASYNEKTGQWMKDPNNGPVKMVMSPDGGADIVAEDEAKTAVEWNFTAFRLTGEVVHGEGEFVINGFIVNDDSEIDFRREGISVREGSTPEVVFRGKPGWVLDYLEVDGVREPFTIETFNRYFANIAADHDVKVGFKKVFEKPYPGTAPYTHLYDGTAYGCLLTDEPNFADDLTFNWWPVYSLDPNGEFTKDGGQITVKRDADGNVVPQTVNVRVCIEQPGYEEPVTLEDWTGENLVTILPREVTIQINNEVQTGDDRIPESEFSFFEVTDALRPGDRIVVDDYDIAYPDKGKNAPITDRSVFRIVDADGNDVTGNYNLTVNPGTYYYPPDRSCVGEADGVVKYYDGQASQITVVDLTTPVTLDDIKADLDTENVRNFSETRRISYSTDGGKTWTSTPPAFTEAGEYTVTYKISGTYSYQYRNIWWRSVTKDYEEFVSSEKVVIKPREVVVTANSAEKVYDGTALTDAGYTVTPRDDANGKGFAAGEGFASLNMTAGSTITEPGTVANTPDVVHATLLGKTDLEKNYTVTVVDGSLTVTQNPLRASASDNEKIYDGEPITWSGVAVTDSTGKPLDSGYTIYYRTEGGDWTPTLPELWTDAGEYPLFWKVDGGAGRGVVEGVSVLTINSRTVTLVAGSAEQNYTGAPLTCTDFTVKPGTGDDYGFVPGEGVTAVVMTKDSTITDPGKTANKIDLAAIDQWTFLGDTKAQNYTFVVEDGTLKVNWVKEIKVTGPGVLTWTEQITVPEDAGEDDVFLTITIDGGDPIQVAKGNMNDPKLEKLVFGGETNIEHVVSFVYTNDYGPQAKCTVSEEVWVPYDTNIAPALKDDPSAADFVITNLGTDPEQFNKGTTIYNGEPLVTVGLLDENGVQTNDVVNTTSDATTKGTEDYWYVVPDPRGGENTVAKTAPTLETNEVVTLTVTVTGDGEFSWDSLLQTTAGEGKHPANITVIVDGQTNQVYGAEEDWTKHTIHVTDEPGKDGAEHLIEIIYTQDGDDSSSVGYLDNLTWKPSATKPEMQQIVRTDPPTDAEETQTQIRIDNNPESGWMPVKDPETGKVVAVRSPDGNEGNSTTNDLDSTFTVEVTGTGEIKVDRITTPIKPSTDPSNPNANTDNGQLTITVDGKTFKIPPESDETISYTIRTEGDMVIIENLVIKVTGEPDQNHVVVFEYTRDADDPTGNTASVITGIEWKTYGENGKGGSSWLQGKALWIIDHEDPGDGWVYLAFRPELKVEEELTSWVKRSDANNMIRVKYGETRAEADACTPVIAHLSDKPGHEIKPVKVWIKVSLNDLKQVAVVKPVGYWRIFIDGPAIRLSGTEGNEDETVDQNTVANMQAAAAPGLQDVTPPIIGEGAVSINTFGILKIERATTNSMIAVPWTWYSKLQNDAENIPVKKLVKTTNLEEGDYLYAPLDNDTYAAWTVEYESVTDARGNVYTNSKWSAVQVVRVDQDGFGRMQFRSDDDDDDDETYTNSTRIARGNGLWLHRQKPLDDAGNIRPFWVYGQSVTTEVTTVISEPTGTETVHSTMIGNPYARDLVLNEINFEGTIDSGDRIKIHTLEGADHDLVYVKGKGWREYVTKIVNGVKKSGYTYQTVIPAGMAFWYDRRGTTPLKITWPKPQE